VPAFTFPGQGSQRPGMGTPWIDHPSWELVADASETAGRDVAHLLLEADADELTETRNAQLATFTLSMVVLDAIERLGIAPTSCAGHSLGEYSALVASGALSFDEGVAIVAERGDAMQAAADQRPGTMIALMGVDDETADVACRRSDGDAWVANYNAPGQVVIAGESEAVTRAGQAAKDLGARKVLPIAVGGAFHTPFMSPARDRLRKALGHATFHEPEVPVVANVDALPHTAAEDWRTLLSAQLCSPVRWRQSVLQLAGPAGGSEPGHASDGEQLFVECGPGGVLTGLARRIAPTATAVSVAAPGDLERLVEAVAGTAVRDARVTGRHGEHLDIAERVVISPNAGIFQPAAAGDGATAEGELLQVGDVLGQVAGEAVRSPFRGWLMGMLAHPGERLQPGQPVAWLRAC
jgi:[acyl-carrier-protein] S-malonyltransferase